MSASHMFVTGKPFELHKLSKKQVYLRYTHSVLVSMFISFTKTASVATQGYKLSIFMNNNSQYNLVNIKEE